MIVSAIAAIGKNRVIGKNNKLMWHLPLEFKHFKNVTKGHNIITGRKNFESFPKPLSDRRTIVVTRNSNYLCHPDCLVVHSLEDALARSKKDGEKEVFIIGGGQIYKQSLPYLHRFYCTIVDFDEEGDIYFPEYKLFNWKIIEERVMKKGEKNSFSWTFQLLEKKAEKEIEI